MRLGAVLLIGLLGCGGAGPASELLEETRPVVRATVADVEIEHAPQWDNGCKWQITVGDQKFGPDVASRGLFATFMGGAPRKSARLTFLVTDQTMEIWCGSFKNATVPQVSIQSVAARGPP